MSQHGANTQDGSALNLKRVMLFGYSGRMGTEIVALAPEYDFQITGGFSSQAKNSELKDVPKALTRVSDFSRLDPAICDSAIDFSLPELTAKVVSWCVRNHKPLVSGVTGLDELQKSLLEDAAKTIPVFWSSNMSVGIAVLERMLGHLQALEDFDFQIEEFHHHRKKDRPSGTALLLQAALAKAIEKPLPEPISIRGGGIAGMHRVFAMGEEEMLTFEHTAMNRRVFARGALRAAQWLNSQPAGLYGMQDLLGR